jgi:UPF0716 protein FxsA
MLAYLIVLFLLLPFIDLYLLIELTSHIGFPATVGLVIATGIAGAFVVKREGRNVLGKLQKSVSAQEISRNLLEGILLAIGGLMLLSPGLITDLIGFMMVLRPTRERIMLKIASKMREKSNFRVQTYSF